MLRFIDLGKGRTRAPAGNPAHTIPLAVVGTCARQQTAPREPSLRYRLRTRGDTSPMQGHHGGEEAHT